MKCEGLDDGDRGHAEVRHGAGDPRRICLIDSEPLQDLGDLAELAAADLGHECRSAAVKRPRTRHGCFS